MSSLKGYIRKMWFYLVFNSAISSCDAFIGQPPPTLPKGRFSDEFVDFVDRCLKKNPSDRADLQSLMNHPFVKKYETSEISIGQWVCKVMDINPS